MVLLPFCFFVVDKRIKFEITFRIFSGREKGQIQNNLINICQKKNPRMLQASGGEYMSNSEKNEKETTPEALSKNTISQQTSFSREIRKIFKKAIIQNDF